MKQISIVWTTDLAVGIEEIDEQHRQLYALLARFYTNLQKGAGRDILGQMLEDLMSYAGSHFVCEESYLQNHPELMRHHEDHYRFIKQMNQFEREYLLGNISLAVNMVSFVSEWLQEHISSIDKEYFLGKQNTSQ